jgi:hypothetical protein
MEFQIAYEKEYVQYDGNDRTRTMSVLDQPKFCFVDTVLVFFAHALHHGLLHNGCGIDTVLSGATKRRGRELNWKDSSLPLITRIDAFARMQTSTVYSQSRLKDKFSQMCQLAGALCPLRSHDVRRGSASDLSQPKAVAFDRPGGPIRDSIGREAQETGRGSQEHRREYGREYRGVRLRSGEPQLSESRGKEGR